MAGTPSSEKTLGIISTNPGDRGLPSPFVDSNGKYVTVQLDASGNLPTVGGGDGAIVDGVSSSIKATVLDLTSANPLTVAITDANGDQITSFGGGTQYTEDAAAAANPVGTALNLVRDDARGGSLTTTDGDNVAARGTNAGELYVKHVDSVAVTNAGLTELAAAINASSQMDVNIAASGATVPVSNAGLTELAAAINASSQMDVNIAASGATVPISNAGITTIAGAVSGTEMQVDVVAALPAGTNNIGDVDVLTIPGIVGTIADDATTPGSPVMIGGTAKETDGTTPGTVSAEDDVARLITDRNRRLLVNTAHPFLWKANENHSSAQTNNALKAAPGSGLSLYITDIIISNGATAGTVKLVEDTGGTPADIAGPYYFAANGGMSKKFATPLRLTADKDLGFTSTVVTTHTVTISGYTAP